MAIISSCSPLSFRFDRVHLIRIKGSDDEGDGGEGEGGREETGKMSSAGQRFSISFLLLLLCLAWVGIASIVTVIAIAKEVGSSIKFYDKKRGRIKMSIFVLNQIWLCFLLHICGGFTLNLISAASACTHAPLRPAAYSPPSSIPSYKGLPWP